MKYTHLLILILILVGCGGGGGGSSLSISSEPVVLTQSVGSIPVSASSMVLGKFTDANVQHVVIAHLKRLGPGITGPAPVKVFQLNANGTIVDNTVEILGGAVSVTTNYPLVADFNKDGIDDIFLPGFTDTQDLAPSVAFISRPGQSHIRVDLPDAVFAHGATVIDVNRDGNLDVMSAWGEIWFNNGQGNFRFQSHSYDSAPGLWIHGSGICAGDFNNTGTQQIVLTDQMIDSSIGPVADTILFELSSTGLPVAQHVLPVPTLDRILGSRERSHDVTCISGDINNDGLLDIIVFGRPWALPGALWTNEGVVQILINRGNWQFEDVSDASVSAYNRNVHVTYTPILMDLDNDGKLDLWLSNFDSNTGNSNQALLNSGTGIFRQSAQSTIASFNATGGMLPVKFGNKWAFLFMRMQSYSSAIYFTKPIYSFD